MNAFVIISSTLMSFLLIGLISVAVQVSSPFLYAVYVILSFLSYFFVSKVSESEKVSAIATKVESTLLIVYPLFCATFTLLLVEGTVMYTLLCVVLPILLCRVFNLCNDKDDNDSDKGNGKPVVEHKKRFGFKISTKEQDTTVQQPAYLSTENEVK